MDANILNYGSLITISTKEGYYLSSEGFINSLPLLRHNEELDYSSSVFRVIPKCMHSIQTSIVNHLQEIRDFHPGESLAQLSKLEENLEGEIRTNINSFNLFNNQEVRYYSLIQLEHLQSHKFLTLKSELSANSEKDNFKLSFEDFPSKNSHFRIIPSFKYQELGSGCVRFSDKVYLQIIVPRLRRVAWLHGSRGTLNEAPVEIEDSCFFNPGRSLEINMSLDLKTRWLIGFYGKVETDEKLLACGDYVRLNIPEVNMILTVQNDESLQVAFSKELKDSNGIWLVEHEDPLTGGLVNEDKRYRFKHITSGRYLGVSHRPKLFSKPVSRTLWRFVLFRDQKSLRSEEICYLINNEKNVSFKCSEQGDIEISEMLDELSIYQPCKVDSEYVWELLFMRHCYPILDSFPTRMEKLLSAGEGQKKILRTREYCKTIIQCITELKLFVQNQLKTMIGMDNHYGEVQHMRQMILYEQKFFIPLVKMLDSQVFEKYYKLIKEKRIKENQFKKVKKEKEESLNISVLIEILTEVYNLLISICSKNTKIQKELFKYRKTFTKHIGLNLGATTLLLEIIRNNEELILTVGNDPQTDLISIYIKKLIKFSQSDSPEFMKFLRGICNFQDEPVSVNQDLVFAKAFKNQKNAARVTIKTEIKKNKMILTSINSTFPLGSSFEDGRLIGNEKDVKYFGAYLKLCASLVKGRNFETSEPLMSQFPFELVEAMMWKKKFTVKIRASFCKLMLDLYIDCYLREVCVKPNLIKLLGRENLRHSIQGSLNSLESFERAFLQSQKYMPELVQKIFVYLEDPFHPKFDNVFTFGLVKIVEKMIQFEILPSEQKFTKKEDFQLVRMIKDLMVLINLNEHGRVSGKFELQRKATKIIPRVSNEFRTSYLKYLSAISKDLRNYSNPIVRSSANLKKFLNFYKQNPLNYLVRKTTSHKIKLKVCEILQFYLMIRQDYLLDNIINWFKDNGNNPDFYNEKSIDKPTIAALKNLLPEIQMSEILAEIKENLEDNKFTPYKQPEIPDLESIQPKIIPNLISKFLVCNNYQLQIALLELIFRNYRQRSEFLKNIGKLHVLSRTEDISLYVWLKNTLLALKHDCEKSEIWMNFWEYPRGDLFRHKSTFQGVLNIIENMKFFFYEDVYVDQKRLSEPTSRTISKSRQEILYFLNVHTILINLIKDGLHKLVNIYKLDQENELKEPVMMMRSLFEICFKILKRFVYTNKSNQKKMFKFLPVITQFLYLDLGQIPLICEIFRDNLLLINKIDLQFLQIFETLVYTYGHQAEFLKLFEVITVVENKPVPSMQRLVLSMFIKDEINTRMLYMTSNTHPVFTFDQEFKEVKHFKDEPFKYHATLILVLSKCGFGHSGRQQNEARCQNLISLQVIFEILNECKNPKSKFLSLRVPLLMFYYNIYLDCDVFNMELKQNPLFLDFLEDWTQELKQIQDTDENYLEAFSILVKILTKYRIRFIKKVDDECCDELDIKAIKRFCQTVQENEKKLSFKLKTETVETLFDLCILFSINITIDEKNDEESQENNQDENIEENQTFQFRRLESIFGIHAIKDPDIKKWIKIREFLILDENFKKMIERENLVLKLVFIHSCKYESNVDFDKILKSLITFVRLSMSQNCPTRILIDVIDLIGSFIENPKCEKATTEKEKKTREKEVAKFQFKMSYFGLTNIVLTMLMDKQIERSVFKALIVLSTKLLEGGNYQIQQEFYQFFLTCSTSDHFFSEINSFFDVKIEKVSRMTHKKPEPRPVYNERKQFIKTLLRFLQLLCENHNKFLQNYLRFQEKSHANFNLVTKVIIFLDILMKKKIFIHFPIISQCFETLTELIQGPCFENQEEILKTNFIEIAEELLSIDEYKDTLVQFKGIQLNSTPTQESFVEDMELDYNDNFYLAGWMIAHLKLKCLITILSLFEGRRDTLVSTKIIRGMNLEIFQENIKSIYISHKHYHEKYSQTIGKFKYNYDIFNHFKSNDEYDFDYSNPQDGDSYYYTSIIENGFLLYHILKTLQDSNDPEHIEALNHELSLMFEKIEIKDPVLLKKTKSRTLRKQKIMESINRYEFCGIKNNEEDAKLLIKEAYKFFEKHTGNIEVIFNGQIFRIYFYLPPAYKGFNKEIKSQFHLNANRDSDQAKLKYMIDSIPDIIRRIEHEFFLLNLIKKSKIADFIASNVEWFRQAAFIITILLNLTIMTSYKYERNELSAYTITPDDDGLGAHSTRIWMNVLGILQLVFCLFIVIFFLAKAGPNLAKKGWKIKRRYLLNLKASKHAVAHILVIVIQVVRTIFFVMSDFDVLFYICYAVFSVLGTILHPFYFSLLLLDLVYRSPSLQNVVNSIYLPRKALVLTFVLLIVTVYIFTIFAYWMFEDYFTPNCKSLVQCFYTVWDYSFKYDGGIGGYLGVPFSPSYDPVRFFFDNIYNILVMIVLMGVVQGIIIDTFARLREDQEFCKKDMKNKCFICGLQRDHIEKNTVKGFVHHIENDHNIWNYILFIYYLLSKDPTEYSGIESFVREQYDKEDLAWIPNKIALSIREPNQQTSHEEISAYETKLKQLETQIKELE